MQELDRAIIEKATRGDRRAREAVVRRYVAPLHALARRWSPRSDPDDLAQDLLSRLLEALPRFDPDGPARFTTWVFTIAQRHLIDAERRRRLAEVPLEEGLEIADGAPSPERLADGRGIIARLEAALARLPSAQRRVFLLAIVHGQALEAIAEGEGVAVGTVKSRLHRARAELASILDDGGHV